MSNKKISPLDSSKIIEKLDKGEIKAEGQGKAIKKQKQGEKQKKAEKQGEKQEKKQLKDKFDMKLLIFARLHFLYKIREDFESFSKIKPPAELKMICYEDRIEFLKENRAKIKKENEMKAKISKWYEIHFNREMLEKIARFSKIKPLDELEVKLEANKIIIRKKK